jgi:nicotinamide-nucleotide amidase
MHNELVAASIITIGDELMIGQVTDTNSSWIAQQLNKEGIWIRRRVAVGDDRDEILKSLDEEIEQSKLILITGGLGPTADDITKPLLCEYFNMKLVTNNQVLQHVRHLFENVYKRPFTEINKKQAEVPDGCTVIHNARGTAPGMWFEKKGAVIVSMPGVPYEMKGMMFDTVLPMIRQKFTSGTIIHKTLLTVGVGESALAEHIKSWEPKLPAQIKLAYLPGYGMIRLRLTASGNNKIELEDLINTRFLELQTLLKEWLVASEDITLVQLVSRLLKERKKTLVTAESCTGGFISHLITSEPGSSEFFKGAFVTYSNDLKTGLLHVNDQTIKGHGAVSEETVVEMVKGALEETNANFCVATSGIMGPDGGSAQKPVGMVWIAIGDGVHTATQKFQFSFERLRNIELTSMQALNMLRKFIIEHS